MNVFGVDLNSHEMQVYSEASECAPRAMFQHEDYSSD